MGVSRNMYEPQYIETPAFKRARSLPFEIDSTFVLGGTLRSAPEPSNLVLSPLYRSLEAKRNEWAERSRTQPYKIFQNQTIEELSIKKPCTTEELLDIHGIGPVKLEQYGSQLLQVINAHLGNPSCVDCHTAVAPNKPRCLKCYRSMQKEVNNLRF